MKNFSTKKASVLDLSIGVLRYALNRKKKIDGNRLIKNIKGYRLVNPIKKENKFEQYSIGLYVKNGAKFFIKTFTGNKKDLRCYFLINEWYMSKLLYQKLKTKKGQLYTPEPIEIIHLNKSVSIVFEFIEGKSLSTYSTDFQKTVFVKILNELKEISRSTKKSELKFFPKRSFFFFLFSLPLLTLITILINKSNVSLFIKAFLGTLWVSLSQKIDTELILAHRDLKSHNIIVKGLKIYLLDTERVAFTLPGYDLTYLSLDPAYSELIRGLEEKLQTIQSKFIKSYIAIQRADSNSTMGSMFLESLRRMYAK